VTVRPSARPPPWAEALAGAAPAALVVRAVRLARAGWADAARLGRAVGPLLDRPERVDVADVLDALEHLVPRGAALPDHEATATAGAALVAAGATVALAGHPGYPERLLDAWPELGAPAWLFVRAPYGRLPAGPAVTVVGTRRPSLDGLDTARELGRRLARAGVVVVSGLARGIDQAAHRGALDAGGATVAVLGTGLDVDYPRGDAALRAAVAAAGGLVTEHVCGAPPRPRHFLERNRIIAGLADLTVVVEGQRRSGSLQTARLAAAQGREVWAVPGSVNAPASRGPLDLIRDGAQVVTRLDDVVEAVAALPPRGPAAAAPPAAPAQPDGAPAPPAAGLGADARAVCALLGSVPVTPGALAEAAGLALPLVLAAVGELVGRGLAVVTPRGVVGRHHAAQQG
jgi:DNA processing protein